MHILIGLVLVLVLLYYWLLGHWFARVVTLILFVPLFALGGGALLASGAQPQASSGLAILGMICGCLAGWFAAGIPVYYWRHAAVSMATPQWRIRELTAKHLAAPPGGYTPL